MTLAAFFERYAAASSALDERAIAAFHADACMAAAPGFAACTTSREQLAEAVHGVVDAYRTIGRGETTIVGLREHSLGRHHVLATVRWRARFDRLAEPVEFEVSYVVQLRDDGDPNIVFFVSHEDEQAVLREKGLLRVTAPSS